MVKKDEKYMMVYGRGESQHRIFDTEEELREAILSYLGYDNLKIYKVEELKYVVDLLILNKNEE